MTFITGRHFRWACCRCWLDVYSLLPIPGRGGGVSSHPTDPLQEAPQVCWVVWELKVGPCLCLPPSLVTSWTL